MCKYNNICFTNNIWKLWKYNDIGLNKKNIYIVNNIE